MQSIEDLMSKLDTSARRETVLREVQRLQQATGKAVEILQNTMADPGVDAVARVSSAKAVLEFAMRIVQIEDLETRRNRLETEMELTRGVR